MRVLVLGSGGREHALCWKLAQEAEVHCAPGNPGIASCAEIHQANLSDHAAVVELCRSIGPDLVVVGPENPLIEGLADSLRAAGYPVFGPGADGAALEGSKAFSKEMMALARVPTASFVNCSCAAEAERAAREMFAAGKQVAVKASGNALGKGVVVAETLKQALEAIDQMMIQKVFGGAGDIVVIEERLIGWEFSLLTICSGTSYVSLPVAQDYKRIGDSDQGPNTGGMGTYSPVADVTSSLVADVERIMVKPMLAALAAKGIDYRGVLFTGVMQTADGPKCLEYNVRFGDPETQTVLRRIGGGFADLLLAAANGEPLPSIAEMENAVVTVVMANAGYPGPLAGNPAITIPTDLDPSVVVFHAGTKQAHEELLATGGRVLAVSADGKTIAEARQGSYRAVQAISFDGAQYRTDIAARAL